MSRLEGRISKLEQRNGIEKYYLITGDNEGNVHIQRTPTHIHNEHMVMSEAEFAQWKSEQPDDVTVITIVHPDGTRFISHGDYA